MLSTDAYDVWLLDLDGTLVDAEPGYRNEVFDRVGDRLGRAFTPYEREVLWHGLGGSRDAQLREWGLEPEEFWTALHAVEDPQTRAESTYLHEDAAFVADLDRPVGLVTHCAEFLARPVLDHLDITDWFDSIVCCDEQTGYKPDPRPLHIALRGLNTPRGARGVYVGDGGNDVEAAANAGLDSVHIERHDPAVRGQCVLGDHRITSFDELRSPVRKLA